MTYLNNFLLFFIFVNILFADPISRTRRTAITEAIEKVGPAVVSINVEKKRSSFSYDPFFGIAFPRDILPMQSSGSGVIISPDGYLLTNQHVIESAERITAILSGGDEYSAQLIGSDETTDLALLKLEGRKFPYAELGDSEDLLIGEWIIAMGNPFQLFSISNKPSASAGIISATHMDFGQQKSGKVFQDMIQTDAAINPGNSGGPLVNALGEVIGINTFIFTGSDYSKGSIGISFAIPINAAKRIAKELRLTGHIDRGYSTGLQVQPVTKSIANYLNIPFNYGVIVVDVSDKSPAQYAGLNPGDVILTVNNERVSRPSDIRKVILENDLRSGDELSLMVYKNKKKIKLKIRLGKYNPN